MNAHRSAMTSILCSTILIFSGACTGDVEPTDAPEVREFDVQGHRGHRGLVPPGNTMPSFRSGLAAGVNTLEADMRLSNDGTVFLSHDDDLRTIPCTWTGADDPASSNLSELSDADVVLYDCQPQTEGVQPPASLIDLLSIDDNVAFNLEFKSRSLESIDAYMPPLIAFNAGCDGCLADRLMVQGFGWDQVEYARTTYGAQIEFEASVLGGGPSNDFPQVATYAQVWSPDHKTLTSSAVGAAHSAGLRVIPWTVNEEADMRALIELEVDGMITDHPEVLIGVLGR